MRLGIRALVICLALVGAGCRVWSPPIAVEATPTDVERLTGQWLGEYEGGEPDGRRGTISFTLIAGEDHAHGDVLMIPLGTGRPYERSRRSAPYDSRRDMPPLMEALTIRFVRAVDGAVSGALDPYWDPDRQSQATTIFRGYLRDGSIEGRFVTTFDSSLPSAGGRWRVTRRP